MLVDVDVVVDVVGVVVVTHHSGPRVNDGTFPAVVFASPTGDGVSPRVLLTFIPGAGMPFHPSGAGMESVA